MARLKTAVLVLTPALLVVLLVVAISLSALSDLPASTEDAVVDAGVARVGDDLAVVIVADGAGSLGETRSVIADWGLLMPALALCGAAILAWWVSGRIHGRVDDAAAAVRNADRDRQSRLQEVVHELRTPLAVMGTNLELATLGDAGGVGYIDAARRAVDRMARTVDDLEGHGQLAVEQHDGPVDLSAIARSVGAEHVGPAKARGIHVLARDSETVFVPAVDPAAVRAALGNFLSNAVRLAPIGSAVVLDWGTEGEWAWAAVTDRGPGIAEQFHVRAFERGWQGVHDRDRPHRGGSGLGLSIARQLTEAQGGLVTVDSTEGEGATFAIWLPLTHHADAAAVVAPDGVHPAARPWLEELSKA